MKKSEVIQSITTKFGKANGNIQIPLLKGSTFNASLVDNGIMVDNLGSEPFLPWEVFTEAVALLQGSGGQASRGDAMNSKLGEPDLYITSVEGFIAHAVYNKQPGDSVFRRITPIACILIWAGICRHQPGQLVLNNI